MIIKLNILHMKRLFSIFLFALIGVNGLAQQLQNTDWTVTDTTDTFYIYFSFSSNTLSYSYDGISFTDIATFVENGNNYTMIDLASGPCPSDTGKYTFMIQNDSLFFTMLEDDCPTRPMIFEDYNWFIPQAGLDDLTNLGVNVFPSPSVDELTIQIPEDLLYEQYVITDLSGNIVLSDKLNSMSSVLDIQSLNSGTYFLAIVNYNSPIKFIKE